MNIRMSYADMPLKMAGMSKEDSVGIVTVSLSNMKSTRNSKSQAEKMSWT